MLRALYTAGSGMLGQQFDVDVISNNLANVNTTAYKKQRAEFKDLLYETLDKSQVVNGNGKPANLQVGHGVAAVATVSDFSTGALNKTDNNLDFALNGDGFFVVRGPNNQLMYTRDGSFKLSPTAGGNKLVTSEGYPVLDQNGNDIILNFDSSKMKVGEQGKITYTGANGAEVDTGMVMGVVSFPNREGLLNSGNNFYTATAASGQPVPNANSASKSLVVQKYLEASNVQVVEEMVKLIVAQRAYDVNSKAIQSADEMLQQANNLKR